MFSSGILSMYENLSIFVHALPLLLRYSDDNDLRRKLILVDVAPTLLFFLSGYLLDFVCFIGEILIGRKKESNLFTKTQLK